MTIEQLDAVYDPLVDALNAAITTRDPILICLIEMAVLETLQHVEIVAARAKEAAAA